MAEITAGAATGERGFFLDQDTEAGDDGTEETMPAGMIGAAALAAGCGALVGVALGLTGGGGSIFAVPLLIYLLGLQPADAAPLSLVAVATTAAVGALRSIRGRLVVWQPAILFALGGFLGAPLGGAVGAQVPADIVVVGFGLLALTIGILMWWAAVRNPPSSTAVRARSYEIGGGAICVLAPDGQLRFNAPCALILALVGVATGLLSGLFGVGGGFLIVPALVLATRMGVHRAVATSLVVITAIGYAGAAGALLGGRLDWQVLVPFAGGGAVAMLAARRLAERVAGPSLQKTFATLIVLVGAGMVIDTFLEAFASGSAR
jgi:hypothetical protein